MKPLSILLCTTFLLFPAGISAQQEPSAARGVVVVSYQKCDFGRSGEVVELQRTAMAPVLNAMVAEGKFQGWGVLEHLWGDEWNNVVYYVASDLASFHAAYSEAIRLVIERDATVMETFTRYCTEHKDNIYRIVPMSTRPAQ
jgi:hypothetical protein